MKIKNIKTNVVFNLPKKETDSLISENPDIYELVSVKTKKQTKTPKTQSTNIKKNPETLLPLIWDERAEKL